MNTLDTQYQNLLQDILDNGITKQDRTGTGTTSVFGRQIRHKMSEGFPLLTTKKMAWKSIVTELLWFLRGDTNIKYLVDNDCHIWDGDAYNFYHYQKPKGHQGYLTKEQFVDRIKTNEGFANIWGDLGPIYGKQWRNWYYRSEPFLPGEEDMIYTTEGKPVTWSKENDIDQIKNLIYELKTNPDSRRLMVSAWNVGELGQMILPPCHYGFQLYTKELNFYELRNQLRKKLQWTTDTAVTNEDLRKVCVENNLPIRSISLMWNQRSVDTFLGLPFNIASYGLLLEIIAKEVNMVPDELIGNLGDTHLYLNHIEQAKEQISRTLYELPKLKIEEHVKRAEGDCLPMYKFGDFTIENYQSHPSIKAPLSN